MPSNRLTRLVRRRNKVAHAYVIVVHEEGREPEMWAVRFTASPND